MAAIPVQSDASRAMCRWNFGIGQSYIFELENGCMFTAVYESKDTKASLATRLGISICRFIFRFSGRLNSENPAWQGTTLNRLNEFGKYLAITNFDQFNQEPMAFPMLTLNTIESPAYVFPFKNPMNPPRSVVQDVEVPPQNMGPENMFSNRIHDVDPIRYVGPPPLTTAVIPDDESDDEDEPSPRRQRTSGGQRNRRSKRSKRSKRSNRSKRSRRKQSRRRNV